MQHCKCIYKKRILLFLLWKGLTYPLDWAIVWVATQFLMEILMRRRSLIMHALGLGFRWSFNAWCSVGVVVVGGGRYSRSVVSWSRPGTYNLMPGHQRDVLNPGRTLALIKTNHRQQPEKKCLRKGKITAGFTLSLSYATFRQFFSAPSIVGRRKFCGTFLSHLPRIDTLNWGGCLLHILSGFDIALDDFSIPICPICLAMSPPHFFIATFKVPGRRWA